MYFNSLRCTSGRTDCQGCSLISENEALRREVDRLQKEVERLQRIIETMRKAIQAVRNYCLSIYGQAVRVMSRHQPRGTWSLWKGKGEVAREIYHRLSGG